MELAHVLAVAPTKFETLGSDSENSTFDPSNSALVTKKISLGAVLRSASPSPQVPILVKTLAANFKTVRMLKNSL